jgi:3-phosphoshikimate 1-carboxyvinyltransferase
MRVRVVSPSRVTGNVVLPSSKSISNRVLVMNALAGNKALPDNVSDCDDTRVMVEWMKSGLDIVDVGAAGTAMRFSTALLSVREGCRVITGSPRMKQRPISVLVDALRELGANVEYMETEGFPPLKVFGNPNMRGGCLCVPGGISSQYISALLMIAPMLENGLEVVLTDEVISRPYIDLTISLMRDFGADAKWTDDNVIKVESKPYVQRRYFVESDWSASSYWYEMVALGDGGDIVLPGLFEHSYQGDSEVARIFEKLGVTTEFIGCGNTKDSAVRLHQTGRVCERLDYDFVNQPDLAQTVVVCCCMMGIPFRFTGLQSLKIKETDRIVALCRELSKLGFLIGVEDDSVMYWDGKRNAVDGDVAIDTYEDHRMAMAFAPCAMKMGEIVINNPEVVSKSYPRYWDDLRSVGFVVNEEY